MRRIAFILGGLVVLIAGAIAVLPQLIPSEVYRERIETAASSALGRDVSVTGDIKVRIFPRIEARAGATTIANPEGFGDAPFASMSELRAAVKLIPLIFQRVEIDEFALVEPNIALVAKADGSNNWTFDVGSSETTPSDGGDSSSLQTSLGDVRIIDGQVTFDDRAAGTVQSLTNLNLTAKMTSLDKPLDVKATGSANQIPFEIDANLESPENLFAGNPSNVSLSLNTELLKSDLNGALTLGDVPEFDLSFDGQIPALTELAAQFQIEGLPKADVLGRLTAAGKITGQPDNIRLEFTEATHSSKLLNANLTGAVTLAETMGLDIQTTADIPKLADLAAAMNVQSPGAGVLGKATARAHITGALGDLRMSDVQMRHDSGLLTFTFAGSARLTDSKSNPLTYDGRIELVAPDLKQLAAATGTKLPPGETYRSFALSGTTSGSTQSVMLNNAVVEFDDIRATGQAALSLNGKPRLTGALNSNQIDITPYAVASGAPKQQARAPSGGWGDTPIDLAPLRMVDADLTLNAEGLKFQKFDFGPSKMTAKLANGVLVADVAQTTLFNGNGAFTLTADGSGQTSTIGLKANLNGLAAQKLLQAAANFSALEGVGDLNIDITGSGATLSDYMSSLQGQGAFDFNQGTLQGVNLSTLVSSAQQAIANKALPTGALGANAQTTFRDLAAKFAVKDGVAAIADLKLASGNLAVTGGGSLDIGAQQLSFTFFPEFADSNSGVNGYGLPLKFSGGWSGIKASVDFDWLLQKATADARGRVESEIQDQIRKSLGDDLSGILNGRTRQNTPTPTSTPAPAATGESQSEAVDPATDTTGEPVTSEPEEKQPQTPEDILRDEAKKALGGLLRGN